MKKRLISSSVHCARQALIENFVPLNLGTEHITRSKVIEKHTRILAKRLFTPDEDNDTVILVADGRYVHLCTKKCKLFFSKTNFLITQR